MAYADNVEQYLTAQGFPQNPRANLLSPKNAALLQLASQLLVQGGPQKEPTSFGQGLGLAMPKAMEAYQGARSQEQARQLQQIQMAGGLQQFSAGQAAAKAAEAETQAYTNLASSLSRMGEGQPEIGGIPVSQLPRDLFGKYIEAQATAMAKDTRTTAMKNADFGWPDNEAQRRRAVQQAVLDPSGEGKYYAIQTGAGLFMMDKTTGTAAMIGITSDNSPVMMGQPFRPMFGSNGVPLPFNPGQVEDIMPRPGGAPQTSGQVPHVTPPGAKPILPPTLAVDPAVTRARALSAEQLEAKRIEGYPSMVQSMGFQGVKWGVVDDTIDRAISMSNNWTTGLMSNLAIIPGTPAHNLQQTLLTLHSNLGLGELESMRKSSPTGASGMGQLAEREMELLIAHWGSVNASQDGKQLVENLNKLKPLLKATRNAINDGFIAEYRGLIDLPVMGGKQITWADVSTTARVNGWPVTAVLQKLNVGLRQ